MGQSHLPLHTLPIWTSSETTIDLSCSSHYYLVSVNATESSYELNTPMNHQPQGTLPMTVVIEETVAIVDKRLLSNVVE